jgi:anti-repressor protein
MIVSILVRELAKIVSKKGIVVGEKRLWKLLREWKLIFTKSTEPYQEYVDRGLFEVSQSTKETSKGVRLFKTTRITAKGQLYIINRIKKIFA